MGKSAILVVLVAAAVALTAGQYYMRLPSVTAAETGLTSAYVNGTLPVADPSSPLWDSAPVLDAALSGQASVEPKRLEPFVKSITVKSLNNGTHIAFLLSWADTTKNNRTIKTEEFRDAVAVQIANSTNAPYCMGAPGQRLNILQWKADWQADVDEGFRDLQDAFPNFWVDYYPYAMNLTYPYNVTSFSNDSRLYMTGQAAGNPSSELVRSSPVEENVAEGYGTIQTQAVQNAVGRGVWSNITGWKVVIARAISTGDPQDTAVPATGGAVAFAVWDGASGDAGSIKSVSSALPLTVKGEAPDTLLPMYPPIYEAALMPAIVAELVAIAVLALLIARRASSKRRTHAADEEE